MNNNQPHLPEGGEWWVDDIGIITAGWTLQTGGDFKDLYNAVERIVQEAERIGYEKSLNGKTVTEAFERGRIAGIREAMERLPELIDCEPAGDEMPTDPGLAADQARNYTIKQIRSRLESLIQSKSEQ